MQFKSLFCFFSSLALETRNYFFKTEIIFAIPLPYIVPSLFRIVVIIDVFFLFKQHLTFKKHHNISKACRIFLALGLRPCSTSMQVAILVLTLAWAPRPGSLTILDKFQKLLGYLKCNLQDILHQRGYSILGILANSSPLVRCS